MGIEFKSAIYSVATFYKSDATKDRAKELVNELNSDERQMIMSVLKKPNDLIPQELKDKLISISARDATQAFIPIAHEKDAELSSFDKTMMKVWRAIKDFFGARISDSKLLDEICKYSKSAALVEMDAIKTSFETELQTSVSYDFVEDVKGLNLSFNYEEDLSSKYLKDSFDSFVNKFIEKLSDLIPDQLKLDYKFFILALLIRNEIIPAGSGHFGPTRSFSMENLIDKVKTKGFDNLPLRQQNMVRVFIQEYKTFMR